MGLAKKVSTLFATLGLVSIPLQPGAQAQEVRSPKIPITQDNPAEQVSHENYHYERKEYGADFLASLGFNVAFQGITKGIEASGDGGSFWSGFEKGAIAGLAFGTSKYMVSQDIDFAWPAKILHTMGYTVRNTKPDEEILDRIEGTIGPVYIDVRRNSGGYDIDPSLMMGRLMTLNQYLSEGGDVDWGNSLRTGDLIIKTDAIPHLGRTKLGVVGIRGEEYFKDKYENYEGRRRNTLKHELVHARQSLEQIYFARWVEERLPEEIREELDYELRRHNLSFDDILGHGLFLPRYLIPYESRLIEKEAYQANDFVSR